MYLLTISIVRSSKEDMEKYGIFELPQEYTINSYDYINAVI